MTYLEETAIVTHVRGDMAYLDVSAKQGCGNCSSKTQCGSLAQLFSFLPKPKLDNDTASGFMIKNTAGLKSGDEVVLGLAPQFLIQSVLIMYVLPLISLFLFALIGKSLWGEYASIGLGLLGLVVGLMLSKYCSQSGYFNQHLQPKVLRKVIPLKTL